MTAGWQVHLSHGISLDPFDPIKLCKPLIEERVLGIQQFFDRTVIRNKVLIQSSRLLPHSFSDLPIERSFCLFKAIGPQDRSDIRLGFMNVTRLKPLPDKIFDSSFQSPLLANHAFKLLFQLLMQLASGSHLIEFLIRRPTPQQIAQPRSQRVVIQGNRQVVRYGLIRVQSFSRLASSNLFRPKQKSWRGQNQLQCGSNPTFVAATWLF